MERTDMDVEDLDRPEWNSLIENYDKHDVGEQYFMQQVHALGLHIEQWGIDMRHDNNGLIFDDKMDLRIWEPLDGQDPPSSWPDRNDVREYCQEKSPTIPAISVDDGSFDSVTAEAHEYEEDCWFLDHLVDIKTKTSESWYGTFNLRHLVKYTRWRDKLRVPTSVYMTHIDGNGGDEIYKDCFIPITHNWDWESIYSHYTESITYSDYALKKKAEFCPIVESAREAPDGNIVVDIDPEYQYDWEYFTGDNQ